MHSAIKTQRLFYFLHAQDSDLFVYGNPDNTELTYHNTVNQSTMFIILFKYTMRL